MSADLVPFESHPASPGDLQAGADNLVQQGAEALQNADQTEQAYSPALDAVTGEPGPAVAQASDPVKAKSLAGSESLVWAAVATRYWSQKVRTFNQQVEIIKVDRFNAMKAADDAAATSTLPPVEATQQGDDAKAAADTAARERWYRVYNEEIVSGRSVVQTWLSRGPTAENMQVAREVGAMPDVSAGGGLWGWLEQFLSSGAAAAAADGARRGRRGGRFGGGGKKGGGTGATPPTPKPRGTGLPRLNNADARALASRLGFTKELSNQYSRGQLVFSDKKGKRFISQDIGTDGTSHHPNGRWKMADSYENLHRSETRMGTYDDDLNKVGD